MIDFMAIYIVGSLIAVGMLLGGGFAVGLIEGIKEAYDLSDKLKVIFFFLLYIALACLFSWLSVGYIYMLNKRE